MNGCYAGTQKAPADQLNAIHDRTDQPLAEISVKFSALKPVLGSHATLCKPGEPAWDLSFECPSCRTRTSVPVSDRSPLAPIWKIAPGPLAMMESIQTGDIFAQWAAIWDRVTIEPSIQNSPHPRQSTCRNHFSVIGGEVVQH